MRLEADVNAGDTLSALLPGGGGLGMREGEGGRFGRAPTAPAATGDGLGMRDGDGDRAAGVRGLDKPRAALMAATRSSGLSAPDATPRGDSSAVVARGATSNAVNRAAIASNAARVAAASATRARFVRTRSSAAEMRLSILAPPSSCAGGDLGTARRRSPGGVWAGGPGSDSGTRAVDGGGRCDTHAAVRLSPTSGRRALPVATTATPARPNSLGVSRGGGAAGRSVTPSR